VTYNYDINGHRILAGCKPTLAAWGPWLAERHAASVTYDINGQRSSRLQRGVPGWQNVTLQT
jgi:hypothetical protein